MRNTSAFYLNANHSCAANTRREHILRTSPTRLYQHALVEQVVNGIYGSLNTCSAVRESGWGQATACGQKEKGINLTTKNDLLAILPERRIVYATNCIFRPKMKHGGDLVSCSPALQGCWVFAPTVLAICIRRVRQPSPTTQ